MTAPPSIVFAGTPAFAARALERLLGVSGPEGRYVVRAVLTQPDRPAGRGQRLVASPVKQLALARGLPVLQPLSLKDPAAQAELAAWRPDYLVVAAYGLILPEAVLALPTAEPLNIHASLLPRWRGAAPIARAIEQGDTHTGICIMRMARGLDTGPVCLRRELAIAPDDTAGTLHDRLADLGATAIVDALDGLVAGRLAFEAQAEDGVTYAHKLDKAEAAIDWTLPASRIVAKIRAFDPTPGCQGRLSSAPDVTLRLFDPTVVEPATAALAPARTMPADPSRQGTAWRPGQVIAASGEGVVIASGEGWVRIGQLQRPGGRRLAAAAFLAGHPIAPGDRFETGAAAPD